MKRILCLVMAMVFCVAGSAAAESILWCSGSSNFDQGFVDILEAEGYVVDRLDAANVMTQAKVDLANTYDLVIFGRDTISGDYVNTGEADLWNSITSPMINLSAYLWRNNRWDWIDTGSTFTTSASTLIDLATDDPMYDELLNGVPLDENNVVQLATNGTTVSPISSAGNAKLIGRRFFDNELWVWLAYWETGQEFYPGAGTFAVGPRLAFAAGDANDGNRGGLNLTDAGITLFLNAAYMMSGATFDRPPFVRAGNDLIANVGEPVTLAATVYDPDSELDIIWTQLAGPAPAQFADAAIANTEVTFITKGVYTLKVTVTDGNTTAIDEMTVYVRDNADNALIAHWNFDGISGDVLPDVTGNGFSGTYYSPDGTDPNLVTGNMIPSPSDAVDLTTGDKYWEVSAAYNNVDPNFNDLSTGMTVAAWVNIEDPTIFAPMIIGNGLDGWRFLVNNNTFNITCSEIGLDLFSNGINAFDGKWHHVVGMFDGVASEAHIYVDGQLVNSASVARGSLFTKGEDYPMIQIGNRGDADRSWLGLIDDIKVFNYPLTAVEVETLASEGDRAVVVSAGDDQIINFKGLPIPMDGTLLVDDGVPAAASLTWSVVNTPAGVELTDVTFDDITIEDPMVTFPNVEGVYILRLTADDTVFVDADDVNIAIEIPSCENVITDGLGIASDISGPDGVADCYIDLYDFAAVAADWLRCNNPADANCEWPYQQ